jgi:beta-xylosidase
MYRYLLLACLFCTTITTKAQVWIPDNGDGTYKNPIVYADYSDPDVIRVGSDYYMVASSFNCQPGIPVLHSKDLVNWTIINHVYARLPLQRYEKFQPGQGSWAPSIRYHNGLFYVYFCTPEDGLFMASTPDPAKKWTLTLVQNVANWEDPCPFWDTDGQAYLLHGRVGAGPAILHKMSANGKRLLDNGTIIFQDGKKQPVLEGFKFMPKRDGYYYFMAPAGGVSSGWQSVFRSKNIYGPYEDKIVLRQGNTPVNGPHQGGLVETQTHEWWFIHFQDKGPYGRILNLQPAVWKNGWPVIGEDKDDTGTGQPVLSYRMPNVGKKYPVAVPQTSDDFSSATLGLQWQWQAAPQLNWYNLTEHKGFMRLRAICNPTDSGSFLYNTNVLLQKFTAPAFTATTKMIFHPVAYGDRAGLTVSGVSTIFLCLEKQADGNKLVLYQSKKEGRINMPKILQVQPINTNTVWFRVTVTEKAQCQYAYSTDGITYTDIGDMYQAEKGTWIGAKTGLACLNPGLVPSKGYADFDFFRVTP